MTEMARPPLEFGKGTTRMTHRERVRAALTKSPVDRTPVSFWLHFPDQDHTADLLAASTLALQRRFDLDIVKLMPTGMYAVVDYGVETEPSNDDLGTSQYVSGPVAGPDDWRAVPAAPAVHGELAKQVETVRKIRVGLGVDTPMIQTIYSPLTLAAKLVGGNLTQELLASESLPPLLARIAEDVIGFATACLEAGADGFFFASQVANQAFKREDYERLGVPYDLQVLEALRPLTWLLLLHLHGQNPYMDLADRYPVDAVSWEDRETAPSISEARAQTRRCLVGGVGRRDPLVDGTSEQVSDQVRRAIAEVGDSGLIVAPGCTIPISAPHERLHALREAVGQ